MRIGILSDTHLPGLIRHLDELGPEPARFFATVDLILHGGRLDVPHGPGLVGTVRAGDLYDWQQ
jgi:hypothetical protein